jgi:hypothetical protein
MGRRPDGNRYNKRDLTRNESFRQIFTTLGAGPRLPLQGVSLIPQAPSFCFFVSRSPTADDHTNFFHYRKAQQLNMHLTPH